MGLPDLHEPNPLLTAWAQATSSRSPVPGASTDRAATDRTATDRESSSDDGLRDEAIALYAFAVPDDAALRRVADTAVDGVVELGAGTGYWARLLHEQGVDVVAYDVAPPPSPDNPWFADSRPWFDVSAGDQSVLDDHGLRTLLLVWPTRNEDWPGDAVERYAAAGGSTLVHVGEGPGGHTGDDRFHALIGGFDRCWSCAYDVTNIACVCGIVPLFRLDEALTLPHWLGYEDDLHIHVRTTDPVPLGPTPVRPRRRGLASFLPHRR